MSYRSDMEIGERIADLLGDATQADLAAAVGIDATALSKVIAGRRSLSGVELVLIARELGVPPQSLLAEEEQPAFSMRAGSDDAGVRQATEQCTALIEGYLRLEALVPQA